MAKRPRFVNDPIEMVTAPKEPFTITLPIYYKKFYKKKPAKMFLIGLNWYRNCHYIFSNSVKKEYHKLVWQQIGNLKFDKIKLHYKVFVMRTGTDGPNVRSVIEKFFLDGLVDCGAIVDDNFAYVIGDSSEYFHDRNNPRIEITILPQ